MPQFTILNDRRFWLFFAFALTLAGFPRGYLVDWLNEAGSYADNLHPGGADFLNFWIASLKSLHGEARDLYDPHLYAQALIDQFGDDFDRRWLYPPHFLFFILPLGLLPYWTAFALFMVGSLLVLLIVAAKIWGGRDIVFWLLIAPFTVLALIFGQTTFLVGALFIGALYWREERPILAGIFLGLLTIKPQFGVFFPLLLLLERRFLVIAVASATAATLIGASVAVFGLEAWRGFFGHLSGPQGDMLRASASNFLSLQLTPYGAGRLFGADMKTAGLVQAGAAVIAAVALVRVVLWQAERDTKDMMLVATTYLATPYILGYDLAAPTFAAIWLYLGHGREKAPGFALSLLLVLVATLSFVNGLTVAMGFSAGPFVFAALATALVLRARQENANAAERECDRGPAGVTARGGGQSILARGAAAPWR
ncbi:hypothetical protein J2R99_001091 [Rhodopseudomonas julia]|uniref:DUF2029 domain-containing protein n=1 Tax=Rhodopseudomonas julia TaxID=200617 RepID=A0ABU0C401_9BRAD|nr:glycosyltransferase family 87 protein [Rhodopseudomonas julia]MDQ0325242.1 hypothetical protein [Rhodopseudomonas julia]